MFERKDPPVIDYLIGYTGGSDTLSQVELPIPRGRHCLCGKTET
ncbi:hypothetical protein SS05631_c32980 [Sinorhizobium sp. CCBAU 05631]|nr:hypothetical protein SS05631_c32980 [Sinorhizobium sp. CCBAU 05631]